MTLLKEKLILVTGATRGIGRALTMELRRENANLILVGRTMSSLEALADEIPLGTGDLLLVPLDLRNFQGIAEMAHHIHQKFGRLDGLIGNAATLGALSPTPHISPKTWDEVMSVNLHANWHLIRAFDPLLRISPKGHAIFLTDSIAYGTHPYWSAYAASKAALETMVLSYAEEVQGTSLRVNLVRPHPCATDLRLKATPGEHGHNLKGPDHIVPLLLSLISGGGKEHGSILSPDKDSSLSELKTG